MDKIIRITLCLFIVIFAVFAGTMTYMAYTEYAYRNTLSGTYTYTCTITTDAPLTNVTFFIPVPADISGNSPIVSAFSSRTMEGVPADWETTLFDTGKSTLLKITTPVIIPPEGTTASRPFTIQFFSESSSRIPIDTLDPVGKSAIFLPVQALNEKACPQARAGDSARCFTFTTSLFADYSAAANTTVTITSSITGKNTWTVFEPHSNEYRADVSMSMQGEHRGWGVLDGELTSGTGTYEHPDVS